MWACVSAFETALKLEMKSGRERERKREEERGRERGLETFCTRSIMDTKKKTLSKSFLALCFLKKVLA